MKKQTPVTGNALNKSALKKSSKVVTKKHQSANDETNAGDELNRTAFRSEQHSESDDGSSKNTHEGKTHRAGQHPAASNDNKEDRDSMHEKRAH